jgi:hypothetical protein
MSSTFYRRRPALSAAWRLSQRLLCTPSTNRRLTRRRTEGGRWMTRRNFANFLALLSRVLQRLLLAVSFRISCDRHIF